jgi:hypothetical protein
LIKLKLRSEGDRLMIPENKEEAARQARDKAYNDELKYHG